MDNEISNAAHSAGCTDYFLWEIYPDHFAKPLMVAVKRYARFLKDSGLVKSHSEALETVARAAGFAHWHAFHTVVQGLSEGVNAEDAEVHHPSHPRTDGAGRKSIKALIRAFVFLVQASPDCPPSPEEQAGLSKAAAQIAQACGSPIEPVQDMIGRMNGSDTWDKLLARRPEQATGPLYGFHVNAFDGSGQFVFSSACYGLIRQQDVLFQGFDSRPPSQQREFEAQLDRVLGARPDFLEGLLAKADVMRCRPGPGLSRQRGRIYSDAISKADDLMPKGFRGELSWLSLTNRFYHRLLYAAMVWHSHEGHTAKAIALARRQLRFNKNDNLGIRLWLVVLLAADGQAQAADKAREPMMINDVTDAGFELVNAICHFANGRLQQSAESLYLAVFMYPPTRHVISDDWGALGKSVNDRQDRRTIAPDAQTMVDQYVSASMQLDGLEQTFERWLERPAVAVAEKALAREFHANWQRPEGTMAKWEVGVKRRAALLSLSASAARDEEPTGGTRFEAGIGWHHPNNQAPTPHFPACMTSPTELARHSSACKIPDTEFQPRAK